MHMKKLEQKEWIAVVASLFVVGFFFVFGQSFISFFNSNNVASLNSSSKPEVLVQEVVVGGGTAAIAGSRVTVHYTGKFVDGKVFDSSVLRGEPLQFVLGARQVIEGLDKNIVDMREGGKRLLSIPPELGYGANDYGPIPGNSTLIFEVELLKVE